MEDRGSGGTKLALPASAAHLRRPRLVEAALAGQVAWLLAPAGYGKTRLLADITGSLGHAFVFVELVASPDPVASLLSGLHQAFRREGLSAMADALEPFAAAVLAPLQLVPPVALGLTMAIAA